MLSSVYDVSVPEDVGPGTTVARIRATDADAGLLGTAGIRYTALSGPIAEDLTINPETGAITLAAGRPFDREKGPSSLFACW